MECIVCIFQYCFGLAFSFARDLFVASRFVNDRFPAQTSCGVKNGPRSVNIYKRFMSIWFQKIMSVSVASILMIFLYFHFFFIFALRLQHFVIYLEKRISFSFFFCKKTIYTHALFLHFSFTFHYFEIYLPFFTSSCV